MKVLSYGGGVQTVTLLRLAIEGRLERPDLVIFADTQREPEGVYATVDRERAVCEAAGIPFREVSHGDLGDWRRNGSIHVPIFTKPGDGQLMRTCTDRFKIQPIRKYLRSVGAKDVEMWLGMTVDEIQRVKPSRVGWIKNRYPFIEMEWTRGDCEAYLNRHWIAVAKSACYFCPMRSDASWRAMEPPDLARAVEYDESIRDARPRFKSYVNRHRVPLADRPFAIDGPGLFDAEDDECEGFCFV
jgi:hypothetical protein